MKGLRYDMLCFEGISLMLNIFRGKAKSPNYRTVPPADRESEALTCHKEVSGAEPSSWEKEVDVLDFPNTTVLFWRNFAKY